MQVKRTAQLSALVVAVCLCLGCHGRIRAFGGAGQVPASSGRFLSRTVIVQRQAHRFMVYLPPGYTASRLWPVIVALHGSGECGEDGVRPSEAGLGEALRQFPDRFPCIVVFPQTAHALRYWTDDQEMVLAELAQTVQKFHGDRQRLYLTGYSMGGSGAWFLAGRNPGKFAAIVPICGRITIMPSRAYDNTVHSWVTPHDPFTTVAGHIGHLPVWVYHSADDPIVPVSQSRKMTAALQAQGDEVHYTELRHIGHGAWVPAYADPALPQWLFRHRLSK
jgi:predicted peptidase